MCTGHVLLHASFSGSEQHNFGVLLLMVLHFGYLAKIVDLETAFLYGDLEEEIYMECPQGMSNVKKDDCVILNSASMALFKLCGSTTRRMLKP